MPTLGNYKGRTITPGTDAEVSRQLQQIDSGGPTITTTSKRNGRGEIINPTRADIDAYNSAYETVRADGPIDTSSLNGARPFDFTPPKPATEAAGASAAIASNTDAFTADLAERAKQRETADQDAFSQYLNSVLSSPGETELQDKAYRSTVDPAEAELKDINQQILAEQQALQRRQEALDKNANGMLASGLAIEKERIQTDSIRKQADLSVIQLAKQGKYDSAKQIADRAVAAQFERQKTINDAMRLNYERNKDLFTQAEQRLFETKQGDRERKLEMEAFKEKSRYDQMLKQSDPMYELDLRLKSAAASEAEYKLEVLTNPPPGSADPVTLEAIGKLTDKGRETITATTDTITQLKRIQELVANNSVADLNNPTSEAGRLFQRLSTDVADKMARERTGAVVTKEENGNFKKILGLGLLAQITATPEEISSELDFFIRKHESAATLYDPAGKIRGYLSDTVSSEDTYLDAVDRELGTNDPYAAFLTNYGITK